jgi:HK97 family phage prohead protease
MEQRYLDNAELRIQQNDNGETHIVGYAAKYNVLSHALRSKYGPFKEVIKPGAFDKALAKNRSILARVEHRDKIAKTPKTLSVVADDKGLRFDAKVPSTTLGKDTAEEVRSEILDACSFAFSGDTKDEWTKDKDGNEIRTITEFDNIDDVALTATPAYPGTELSIRSRDEWQEQLDKATKVETAKAETTDLDRYRRKLKLAELGSKA